MKGIKVTKWGNGQGIRIPMAIMKAMSLNIGDELILKVNGDKMILEVPKKKTMTLAERFASYNGPTHQEEFWNDGPVGKEVI